MHAVIGRLYETFARYRLPDGLQVCEQCGPEWTAADFRTTALRSLTLAQLEAVHVMSLDDNGFRYFFPRLVELLASQPSPVFAFDLARLKGRVPSWPAPESAAVTALLDDLWRCLLADSPADLGYFSDTPTLIDFTYWCDGALQRYLDSWLSLDTEPAALHLADLVEYIFTVGEPEEPAVKPVVLDWLRQPAVGERLLAANCEAALDLWTLCG